MEENLINPLSCGGLGRFSLDSSVKRQVVNNFQESTMFLMFFYENEGDKLLKLYNLELLLCAVLLIYHMRDV